MPSQPSIAQLQTGDPDAWKWFFDEYSGLVAGYARRMGVADPEDVTSAVLESVARSVGAFTGSKKQFRSWVFSIAHARIVDDHRRRNRRTEVEFDESLLGSSPSAEAAIGSGDPDLESALALLTEEQRSLLHFRFAVGLPMKEIAQVMGKSEVAARVALHRAQKRLRDLLDQSKAEEESVR